MKIEKRGKYGGVKIHLDPEECEILLKIESSPIKLPIMFQGQHLLNKMGQKIKELMIDEPDLLSERTPEDVAAILAKEVEKAQMQLNAVKSGAQWQKVDKEVLAQKLLAHAK